MIATALLALPNPSGDIVFTDDAGSLGYLLAGSLLGAAAVVWPLFLDTDEGRPDCHGWKPMADGVGEGQFKAALRRFASGVTVVTCRAGDVDHAMTASAFSAVSLDPPLVLVCVNRRARFADALAQTDWWGVSILAEDEHDAARWFATSGRPLVGQLRGIRARSRGQWRCAAAAAASPRWSAAPIPSNRPVITISSSAR